MDVDWKTSSLLVLIPGRRHRLKLTSEETAAEVRSYRWRRCYGNHGVSSYFVDSVLVACFPHIGVGLSYDSDVLWCVSHDDDDGRWRTVMVKWSDLRSRVVMQGCRCVDCDARVSRSYMTDPVPYLTRLLLCVYISSLCVLIVKLWYFCRVLMFSLDLTTQLIVLHSVL